MRSGWCRSAARGNATAFADWLIAQVNIFRRHRRLNPGAFATETKAAIDQRNRKVVHNALTYSVDNKVDGKEVA
jgi:hypothetical protein